MNPGGGLITVVNARLADDAFRTRLREMHAEERPLLDMVDELGLADEMSDAVRSVVAGLGPAEVEGIRRATLEMLDRAERRMPVDCNLSQSDIDRGSPVTVSVVDQTGGRTIQVRPRRPR
jgi:hypothetical protein